MRTRQIPIDSLLHSLRRKPAVVRRIRSWLLDMKVAGSNPFIVDRLPQLAAPFVGRNPLCEDDVYFFLLKDENNIVGFD